MKALTIVKSCVILLTNSLLFAQSEQPAHPISDLPALNNIINDLVRQDSSIKTSKKAAVNSSSATGFGLTTAPPVVLLLNRSQFDEGMVFQSSLYVLPWAEKINVRAIRILNYLNLDEPFLPRKAGTSATLSLVPGEIIPIQTYIFDGSEEPGLYLYSVVLVDERGNILAMPSTTFVFRTYFKNDSSNFLGIDSAEKHGEQVFFKGRFIPQGRHNIKQSVVIGVNSYRLRVIDNFNATVNLADAPIGGGIYDITFVAWEQGRFAYDSTTTQGLLKIFLPPRRY